MHFLLFRQNRPGRPYLTRKVPLGVLENTNNNHMIGVKRCLFHPDTPLFSDKYIPLSFFFFPILTFCMWLVHLRKMGMGL